MKILGDIGNTETKICLVNSKNKIVKKINFKTRNITLSILMNNFSKFNIKKDEITKFLFCSVVPKVFRLIKLFLTKRYNVKCY